MRKADRARQTRETSIELSLNLDGSGRSSISSPYSFFNHLLESLAKHGRFDLDLRAQGNNEHHIIEDTAIVLAEAFSGALGDKVGIERFGSAVIPMDDVLVLVAIDIGGRSYVANELKFRYKTVERLSTEMIGHFVDTLGGEMEINLHARLLTGKNEHHKAEALFKALGVALRKASMLTGGELPSTKGRL